MDENLPSSNQGHPENTFDQLKYDDYYQQEAHLSMAQHPFVHVPINEALHYRSLMADLPNEAPQQLQAPDQSPAQDPSYYCLHNGFSQHNSYVYWPHSRPFERQPTALLRTNNMAPCFDEATVKIEQQDTVKQEEQPSRPIQFNQVKQLRFLGGISPEQRREKINRYLEKRRKRSFAKKVAYDCRKKVADQRIRVKGRFVTQKQALELLELPPGDYSEEFIKKLLTEKTSKKLSQHIA